MAWQDEQKTLPDIGFLLFWAACFCIVGIQLGSLASWDEAYYAVVSKGIAQSGDWVNLTFFNTAFYDKPPLYFWVTALFYKLGGINEAMTRLGSALFGVGTILATYFLGKELFNRGVGLAGAGVLLSSTDFLHYARWGTLDITNLFFFTMAILSFLKARRQGVWWVGFWVASAGAVMTKGPLIVLAWGVLGAYTLFKWEWGFLKRKTFWLGFLLALVLVIPWHMAAYLQNPEVFLRDFIYKHYVSRTGQAVEGHVGNYYYYIRTLINKYHPWIVLAPIALPLALWQSIRSENRIALRFLLFWIAVVLAFFTFLVKTKLHWYILLLHPALSLVIGWMMYEWLKKKSAWWFKTAVMVILILHIPFSSVLVKDYVPAIKALAPVVQEKIPETSTVYLYEYHEQPAALFYFERQTAYLDSLDEVDQALKREEPLWVVIRRDQWENARHEWEDRGLDVVHATEGLEKDLTFLGR